MIYFDTESIRQRFRGYYTFSDNLAANLANEARLRQTTMGFYIPENQIGRYGSDMAYKRFSNYHKFIFPLDKSVELYHVSHQRSKYVPNIKRAQILMTVHDLNFLYEKASSKQGRYLRQYQASINQADRIVAISEYAKKDILEHLDVKGKQVDVVYSGLPKAYDPVEPQYKPVRQFLFTIGFVNHKKNFKVLPCLLKGNDFELIIAGVIKNPTYAESIMEEARKWGVEDRVKIVGTISDNEKYWYYQNCLAFCFPSLAEGFCLPLIEAMHCGKPIFVSDHTCIPEIAGDNAFYFNHDFERDDMIKTFENGLDRFTRGEITPDMIKAQADRYSWATAAKQYFDIYEDMLNKQ